MLEQEGGLLPRAAFLQKPFKAKELRDSITAPMTAGNQFKGRQPSGELIILCVRLYLRYPLSYTHVTELMLERGLEVDASCIWHWVQVYAPELKKRYCPHLSI